MRVRLLDLRRLARITLAAAAGLLVASAPSLGPQYGHWIHDQDPTETVMAGAGSWNCDGTYTHYRGTWTGYADVDPYTCSPDEPIET